MSKVKTHAREGQVDVHAPGQGMEKVPKMRSAADTETYEAKFAWQQRKDVPSIPSPADAETYETKLDQEKREGAKVSNPGQGDFEVKYEHESVWTTKPKRDVDQTPTKK